MSQPARFTPTQLKEHYARLMKTAPVTDAAVSKPKRAKHIPGQMNGTEASYADLLEARKLVGEIRGYEFEAVTLRLAKGCRFTVDFAVHMKDGSIELHECKAGFRRKSGNVSALVRDGAGEKFKWAAQRFPMFRFRLFYLYKREWREA